MPQMRATMSRTSSGVRPDDELLEVARRLEDLQARLDDLAVADDEAERALALDPGELVDLVDALSTGGVSRGHRAPPRAAAARSGPGAAGRSRRGGSAQLGR